MTGSLPRLRWGYRPGPTFFGHSPGVWGIACHDERVADHLQQRVYLPHARPPVEVLVDGRWWRGELRMWTQHRDGSWHAQVLWSDAPKMLRIDTFPDDRVRSLDHQGTRG
jgi:hypothetical protein